MPTYVAMLRGVNVGGKNALKMADLRQAMETLPSRNVQTYVQSGNIIFETAESSAAILINKMQTVMASKFGFSVPIILKNAAEMQKTVSNNPFDKDKKIATTQLHVTFLSDAPTKYALEKLATLSTTPDQWRIIGQTIYLHCPNGYGKTKLSNNALEKLLSTAATTRNWKTVCTLAQMVIGAAF